MLAHNLLHFARILRSAGLAVPSERVVLAEHALLATGVAQREVVRAALLSLFTRSVDERPLFDEAFRIFWRDPDLESKMRALLLPKVEGRAPRDKQHPGARRLAAAFFPHARPPRPATDESKEIRFDTQFTFSAEEKLRRADFDGMSIEEWNEAKRVVARLRLPFAPQKTRRFEAARKGGTIDLRASLAASIRSGGDHWPQVRKRKREIAPPLVVLADISGSMERTTRMLLFFAHALGAGGRRVETFLFGTRLTRATRAMRHRDADVAVERVSGLVQDWGGGTRIGACLKSFNAEWSRRVLGNRAAVLLITDGLERDETGVLETEMRRLKRATRELVWLNPLLRYEAFEARAMGVKAMLPHVHRFLPVHNIDSLTALAAALSQPIERQSWN
jgi:uncharacterized protein